MMASEQTGRHDIKIERPGTVPALYHIVMMPAALFWTCKRFNRTLMHRINNNLSNVLDLGSIGRLLVLDPVFKHGQAIRACNRNG